MEPITTVNIASAAFKVDPFPFYARLRADAPVHPVTLPDKQTAWLVTRYDDVLALLKDARFAKDRLHAQTPEQATKQPWMPAMFKPFTHTMIDVDAPDHTRLRTLVHKVFTPRRIEQMSERVQTLTDDLLDATHHQGRMDIIRDYALPIPITIIAEMLGVPVHDRGKFSRWTHTIIASSASGLGPLKALPPALMFMRYLRRLISDRRAAPRDDLISALIQTEEAGDQLNEDELLSMTFLLLVAGYETTVNLIGSGMLALLEHPEQLDKLRNEPMLIKPAVEELLRYASPLETATERYAREDTVIAGVTIPRGALVYAVLASANRDERQFANPDALDITRAPNKHLAFGQGMHYCLGAPLARLEGQIAINTLLRRLPDVQLAGALEALRWRPGLSVRGLEALPVTFAVQRHMAKAA